MASNKGVKRNVEEQSRKGDGIKWALVWLLVACGVFASWYFEGVSEAIEVAAGIVLFVVVLLAVGWTEKGQVAWGFVKGARQELRRVHWQTRSEVLNVVIRVVLVVAVVTVILWIVDSLFMWAIGLISR
jgi:preprotein translocase subunit SecE